MPPSTTSPIQCLPHELVTVVFRFALMGNSMHRLGHRQRLFFMNLRCVCSQWRSVAFSAAELWTSLHVDFVDGLDIADIESLVLSWFSRAKGLAVQLSLRDKTGSLTFQRLGPILNGSPFKFMTLVLLNGLIEDEGDLNALLLPTPSKEELKHMTITLRKGIQQEAQSTSFQAIFPNLESFSLMFQDMGLLLPPFPITHSNLASLHIGRRRIKEQDMLLLFRALPNLEELLLSECFHSEDHQPRAQHAPIPILPLKRLLVRAQSTMELLRAVVRNLDLAFPRLELLQISLIGWTRSMFSLKDIVGDPSLTMPGENLQTKQFVLDLSEAGILSEELERFLEEGPTIHRLYVRDPRTVGAEVLEMKDPRAQEIIALEGELGIRAYARDYSRKQTRVMFRQTEAYPTRVAARSGTTVWFPETTYLAGPVRIALEKHGWTVKYASERGLEEKRDVDVRSKFRNDEYEACISFDR